MQILIWHPVRLWRQTTAVVNRADRRLTACVVNCYKRSATLGSCCSQSSSVVLMTPTSNRRHASFLSQCEICLSVCLSHAGILSKRLHISSNFFAPSGSPTILVFHTKQDGNTPTGTPLTGASNARYATVSHTLCNYALHVQ